MPDLPVPTQTDVTIQNATTGQVDYLEFLGTTLVASSLRDYGLSWNIVASSFGNSSSVLVAQDPVSGKLDFLYLDPNANLVASHTSDVGVPHVVGAGLDFARVPGQEGAVLVSQLPNGQLD